ncbi:MAG: ribonuclease HII [Acidimicrobiales bacterium]|nr:MAG: ribonuclease HII [Acidimicrobiales bacterium]
MAGRADVLVRAGRRGMRRKGMRPSLRTTAPHRNHERRLWEAGVQAVVGVDEVGRGAWAGPLTVGAAVIPRGRRIRGVRDSKLLTEAEREALFDALAEWCVAWAVGHASPAECDELGMSAAQRLAARRALEALGTSFDAVLVDGRWDFVGGAVTVTGGDRDSLSIAAASVLAKVTRDRLMRTEAESFPGYDFDLNKGYPCPRHKVALMGMGPTSIHRLTWSYVDRLPWSAPVGHQPTLFASVG